MQKISDIDSAWLVGPLTYCETPADPRVANLMDRQLHRPRRSGKLGCLALDRIRTLPYLPHIVHLTTATC